MARSVTSWQPHTHRLYTLSDQGEPRRILTSDFGIQGRDRSWNIHAESFLQANRDLIQSLEIEPALQVGRSEIELTLKPRGVIGAVPLRSPDTFKIVGGVVVKPRFGWNDIGWLLSTIGWSASPELLRLPLVPGSAREVPSWVLAGPILQRISSLLKETTRGFRIQEEIKQTPRGTILWNRYVSQQMKRGAFHQLPCRFPELGPDLLLRAYLRWGLEKVYASLSPYAQSDMIARRLAEDAQAMLFDLRDAPVRTPDHRTMNQMLTGNAIPSAVLRDGLEALGWIVDERGLGGRSESDGLSWRLPMHYLFERWTEHLVREWAYGFGGQVTTARTGNSVYPIRWEHPGAGSLSSLAPDIVVVDGDTTYIFDAKYKGHFEELDESRWREVNEEFRSEHRHDLHQVLAYSAIFDTPRIVSILVYPVLPSTWRSLSFRGRSIARAVVSGSHKSVELALVGVPLKLDSDILVQNLVQDWGVVRTPVS